MRTETHKTVKRVGGRTVIYTQVGRGRGVLSEQLLLVAVLTLTGCLLLALETTALGRIPLPFGLGRAAPSLGLLFCMAAGFLFDERVGGGFGLFFGYLADCVDYSREGSGVMILPLVYFLFGFLSGVIGRHRLAHNLPSFLIFATVGGGAEMVWNIAAATLRARNIPHSSWIVRGTLPVWILTVLFSPLVYLLLRLERKFVGRRRGWGT